MRKMNKRLIINDFKSNKLINISTCLFMAVTAMLLGLSIYLFASLVASIDTLMNKAETPHFLQMHTGDPEEAKINEFVASREDVEKKQICRFLNLPNSCLSIGDVSFETNMQDNGLCCQGECFDYLLDGYNNVIQAGSGEVYVPVAYKNEYKIKQGDTMRIGTEELTVAGFLRDSQMNSMMASSKRFLVSETDYERLKELGSEEYLIEFRLKEGSDPNKFATEYKDAGLPENGPTITYPLIKTMNALSDGIMILVILLVSFVVLFISIICIRYIILTQLEKDRREIGMLKAVGIRGKDIRFLYLSKYLILSMIGCLVGIVLAVVIAGLLGSGIKEMYGETENKALVYIFMILGAFLAEAIILIFVRRTLRRTEKESAVSALCGRSSSSKKNNLWIPAFIISAATVFMILVPMGMKSTMADPEFVTYMGIGNSHIRVDVRQKDDINAATIKISDAIQKDDRVGELSVMKTRSYKVSLQDGKIYSLMLENGDHGIFPVNYQEGKYPENETEIALSVINAEEMGVKPGDKVTVLKDDGNGINEEYYCTVCGIYSDITNGGKTAKGCFDDSNDKTSPMWSIIYISLKDESMISKWVEEYQSIFSSVDGGVKIIEIADYIRGTYGQTIRNINDASVLTMALSGIIIMIVIILLMRLIIWRDRKDSSLKKALGISSSEIRKDYTKKLIIYTLSGVVIGVLLGVFLGQKLAAGFLSLMGATGFKFVINPFATFILVPVLIMLSVGLAAMISLTEIKRIRAAECLNSGVE